MDVLVAAQDPDRAESIERAVKRAGQRAARMPDSFARATDALARADAVVADFVEDPGTAAWCVAYALARGRLVVVTARPHDALPALVRDNPSPYQRIVRGEGRVLESGVEELLRP